MPWKLKPEAVKPKLKIPPVGYFWRHIRDPKAIYMRIDSEVGNAHFQFPPEAAATSFFSVTAGGAIVHTSFKNDDIEIVSPDKIDFSDSTAT